MGSVRFVDSKEVIEEILSEKKAVVFKHSTRCPVSSSAKNHFDSFVNESDTDASLYLIDVIMMRDMSMEFAARTGVDHQSPQLLVLIDGEVVYKASHYGINADDIVKALD